MSRFPDAPHRLWRSCTGCFWLSTESRLRRGCLTLRPPRVRHEPPSTNIPGVLRALRGRRSRRMAGAAALESPPAGRRRIAERSVGPHGRKPSPSGPGQLHAEFWPVLALGTLSLNADSLSGLFVFTAGL